MPDITALGALARKRAGKGAARATRREGRIPAVVYGGEETPFLVSLDARDLARALARPGFFATLAELAVDGARHRVLPREVQYHPVTDRPLHVDFLRVRPDTRVTVKVPVAFVNQEQSSGLRRGGILNIVRHEIELDAPVENIPDRIVVDLTGLEIGDSIHISAVALPPGSRPTIKDRNFTVASIAASSAVREEAAAAMAAAVAPAPPTEPEAS
jgi:large subunit ribosomal protein L25